MRPLALALVLAALTVLPGCGGDDDEPAPPAEPVRLSLEAPRDRATVLSESITLRGSVSPVGAAVKVRGREAVVSGGEFRSRLALELGTNVIDVMATAPGRSPAFAAVRVTRQQTVRVPDIEGERAEDASSLLEDAGLRARVERNGGIIEDLIPRDARVCDTDPGAGEKVARDSIVRVRVGKLC